MPNGRVACLLLFSWLAMFGGCAQPSPSPPTPDGAPRADTRDDVRPAFGVRANAGARREFIPRKLETIFSPLDLPTPTLARMADGRPGPEYWQQQTDYVIEAVLDDERREISGRALITYTNNSPAALDFLWLHLEQNLHKEDSIGSQSSLDGARFTPPAPPHPALDDGVHIEYVRAHGQDLPFHEYDTLARVDLPEPIPARGRDGGEGATFVLEVAWSFRVPTYGSDRMGIDELEQGAVFEIAQWFPAVAAYDDVHGWNTLPYLGAGEFYTDFGDYDVRISVPQAHIVVATGVLQNEAEVLTPMQIERLTQARASETTVVIRGADEVADPASRPPSPEGKGALTWHFKAERVRTFAFASSAAFIWDAASLGRTLVQSAYPKEAAPLWEKSTEMLRFAIDGYNKKWFEYPYPVATNVNGCVGGMEYPMIIFCSERNDEKGLYGVTTHEIGHNWFPMTVNTDERRHAWMDEGFDCFINIYSVEDRFGEMPEDARIADFAHALLPPGQAPVETRPDLLGPGLVGMLEYGKTAIAMYLLREEVLGPERFDAAFRAYIDAWAFKSPRPADFFRIMENAAGIDLAWFWRGWFLETGALDQGVVEVMQRSDSQSATVVLANRAELVMPVAVRLTFEDGGSEMRNLPVEIWHWTNEWTADMPTGGRRVTKVEVDPEHKLPDRDRANNLWEAPPPPPPESEKKEQAPVASESAGP